MTERIQVLRNLFLYGSTYKYYGTYTDLTEPILVLQNLDMYFRSYTCLTGHILILRILYWSYGTYTCLTDFILILRNLYLSYEFYTGLTELILVLRILFLCEGIRRYNKSELIIIVSHTRSDQTYADTYQVWTLVHNRYRT